MLHEDSWPTGRAENKSLSGLDVLHVPAGSTTVLKNAKACRKFGQENTAFNNDNGSEEGFEDGFAGGIQDCTAV